MKRTTRLLSLLLIFVLALGLAGCGSSKNSSAPQAATTSSSYSAYDNGVFMEAEDSAEAAYDYDIPVEVPMAAAEGGFAARGEEESSPKAQNMSEKIIYNADVTLETTDFDSATDRINEMVRELDGYMESTSISGSDYSSISRGYAGTRSAYYTIRVPSVSFTRLTGSLSELGNVPYSHTYTRNVTREYYDVQSRLDAFRTQEKRLLEMLSIAETVEDMLAIQQQLTEVQYEIDSLTGTLRYYDNQVGYSTVNLEVREVREYTPEPTVTLSYWERMNKEFRQSLKDTGNFFKEFFLWLVTSLPWLVPLVIVIIVVIALIRRRVRRAGKGPSRAERRAARKAAKAQRRADRKSKKAGQTAPPADSGGEENNGEA